MAVRAPRSPGLALAIMFVFTVVVTGALVAVSRSVVSDNPPEKKDRHHHHSTQFTSEEEDNDAANDGGGGGRGMTTENGGRTTGDGDIDPDSPDDPDSPNDPNDPNEVPDPTEAWVVKNVVVVVEQSDAAVNVEEETTRAGDEQGKPPSCTLRCKNRGTCECLDDTCETRACACKPDFVGLTCETNLLTDYSFLPEPGLENERRLERAWDRKKWRAVGALYTLNAS